MSKVAWLFPGQGSQAVGMGVALAEAEPAARAVLQDADAALGFPLSKLMAEGPEETLKLTDHTQPAILTHSVMVVRAWAHRLPKPDFAAGHSLGEYSALVALGALGFQDAVRTVRERGRARWTWRLAAPRLPLSRARSWFPPTSMDPARSSSPAMRRPWKPPWRPPKPAGDAR